MTRVLLLYALFATGTSTVNLLLQRATIAALGPGPGFLPAMAVGTLAALVLKYNLDRRWIFRDTSRGLGAHGRKFGLYAFLGLFTTGLFMLTETLFWLVGRTQDWREAGALLGLALGYGTKFFLDRRFVFRAAALAARPALSSARA